MSNHQEYINIFEQHRELIEAPCAELLNNVRSDAMQRFSAMQFPDVKEEMYLHSNVVKLFATDYGMNLKRVAIPAAATKQFVCDVPNLETLRCYLVNDSYIGETVEMASGALIGSLNELAKSHSKLLSPYYNTLAAEGDAIANFNTAFAQDGILVYIPQGVKVEETIQIVTMLHSNVEIMSNRRILIILERGAEANILLCDHSANKHKSLSTQVAEVFVGEGAKLSICEVEESEYNNGRLAHLFVRQESSSTFNHSNITLTNGFTRNFVNVSLEGEGAESNLNGLVINDKYQHTDNHTIVDHKVSHCTSNEVYKYILDEHSTGIFAGKMLIRPGAQQSSSQQTNRNLCLTQCAKMYAQPQLEIYADDVKCSHGSTVGQLDENALFYMQQRGIPKEEARHLLLYAFAGEIIDSIALEPLQERMHTMVEKRFRGELNRCNGCTLCSK